ncbi:hypothetical protein HCN44_001975 [Aphidius gifuensis]|uniref:Uncharacterized protein n=1 Tax=Aphidius gifuensis TaxID=684658 RepID=A0A834XZ90_APHGI|nr:hypothetical protein HCN44_001975 [Aphidius gifuensis]
MSGILRNTLRLVGTAKYAPNNSTKYLQSMTLSTTERISTDFRIFKRIAGRQILSLFAKQEIKTADFGGLHVSLSSGTVGLITREKHKHLIFPPVFTTELNGRPIEPESNKNNAKKKTLSFSLGKWNVSCNGHELKFNVNDSDEIFILTHAVHVDAYRSRPERLENGGYRSMRKVYFFDDEIISFPAKIIISESEGSKPLIEHEILSENIPHSPNIKHHMDYGVVLPKYLDVENIDDEITDKPNKFGEMKLKFPMIVSLEGNQEKLEFKNIDDTLTVSHSVKIQTYKNELRKNLKNEIVDEKKYKASKAGKLLIQLESGELATTTHTDQRVIIKYEVNIEIDLDSEVPSILICPILSYYYIGFDNDL